MCQCRETVLRAVGKEKPGGGDRGLSGTAGDQGLKRADPAVVICRSAR